MFEIFICEDDINLQFFLEDEVRKITEKHNWKVRNLNFFNSLEKVPVSKISFGSEQLYIFHIDVYNYHKILESCSLLRLKNPVASIIFLTQDVSLMELIFHAKISALDCIKFSKKNLMIDQLENCLVFILDRVMMVKNIDFYFILKLKTGTIHMPFDDILYFETSDPHRITLHTKYTDIQIYSTLNKICEADRRLFRCHRSYAINCNCIDFFSKKERMLYLINGDMCPVSKNKISSLLEIFKNK